MFKKMVVLAALLGASHTVFAGTYSLSTSLRDFSYELIDQNPNDGINASVSFWTFSYIHGLAFNGEASHHSEGDNYAFGEDANISLSIRSSNSFAQVAIKNHELTTSLTSNGQSEYEIDLSQQNKFTLSPYTQIIFKLHSAGVVTDDLASTGNVTAENFVFIQDDSGTLQSTYQKNVQLTASETQTINDDVVMSYVNTQDVPWNGTIFLGTNLRGVGSIQASTVPEPTSTGMLMSGLALLGLVSRRNAKKNVT